jgi:hypothetical protein
MIKTLTNSSLYRNRKGTINPTNPQNYRAKPIIASLTELKLRKENNFLALQVKKALIRPNRMALDGPPSLT